MTGRKRAAPGARAARAAAVEAVSENQWLARVRQIAEAYRWTIYHTHNSFRSDAGWPDLVLATPQRLIVAELKIDDARSKPTPAQLMWLRLLDVNGVETALWRPRHVNVVIAVLGPQQRRTRWTEDLDRRSPNNGH